MIRIEESSQANRRLFLPGKPVPARQTMWRGGRPVARQPVYGFVSTGHGGPFDAASSPYVRDACKPPPGPV